MRHDKVYIQKQGNDAAATDITAEYGIYALELGLTGFGSPKELPSNDWHDEDGEEVYVPEGRQRVAAYDVKVKLGYKGERGTASPAVRKFLDWLFSGKLMIYDTHTGTGRREVIVKEVDDDAELRTGDGEEVLLFGLTLRVCDPVTEICLKQGRDGAYYLQ